jgi:hypothetical protein
VQAISCRAVYVSFSLSYHSFALFHVYLVAEDDLCLLASIAILTWGTSRTKGKLSGSIGLACTRNSSLQLSNVSKLFELLTS